MSRDHHGVRDQGSRAREAAQGGGCGVRGGSHLPSSGSVVRSCRSTVSAAIRSAQERVGRARGPGGVGGRVNCLREAVMGFAAPGPRGGRMMPVPTSDTEVCCIGWYGGSYSILEQYDVWRACDDTVHSHALSQVIPSARYCSILRICVLLTFALKRFLPTMCHTTLPHLWTLALRSIVLRSPLSSAPHAACAYSYDGDCSHSTCPHHVHTAARATYLRLYLLRPHAPLTYIPLSHTTGPWGERR